MRGTKVKALNRIFRRFPTVPDSDSKQRFVGSALGGAIPLTPRAFRRELRHNRQVQDAAMSVALVPPVFSRIREKSMALVPSLFARLRAARKAGLGGGPVDHGEWTRVLDDDREEGS